MCFFNSQSKRALEIAKRYGRMTDAVEAARLIIEEQRRERSGDAAIQGDAGGQLRIKNYELREGGIQ